jgi:hypothetical protein
VLKATINTFADTGVAFEDEQKKKDKSESYFDQQKELFNKLVAKRQLINDRIKQFPERANVRRASMASSNSMIQH